MDVMGDAPSIGRSDRSVSIRVWTLISCTKTSSSYRLESLPSTVAHDEKRSRKLSRSRQPKWWHETFMTEKSFSTELIRLSPRRQRWWQQKVVVQATRRKQNSITSLHTGEKPKARHLTYPWRESSYTWREESEMLNSLPRTRHKKLRNRKPQTIFSALRQGTSVRSSKIGFPVIAAPTQKEVGARVRRAPRWQHHLNMLWLSERACGTCLPRSKRLLFCFFRSFCCTTASNRKEHLTREPDRRHIEGNSSSHL